MYTLYQTLDVKRLIKPTHICYFRQLLGTEEESSDRASSEDELLCEEDDTEGSSLHKKDFSNQQSRSVWAITKEQLNYYTFL